MRFLAVLMAVMAIGCGGRTAAVPQGEGADLVDKADRAAVEAWLKENTDSGKWELVRWWTVDQRPITEKAKVKFADWRAKNPVINAMPEDSEVLAVLANEDTIKITPPPERLVRLKFRTEARGAMSLEDKIFVVENNKSRPVTPTDLIFRDSLKKLETNHR